ncbi:50S ribosomal protein L9 [Mycoplasma sp. 1654_15]|uniref:50S ribosomal protein L9 n=1 Tax=Mycoplasma sp. 1654_15 TaxID=2725994 RepID=UPI001449DA0F|nr:50S ribosomal protein L9 [Mycoplasma sp. 1654_15]QJB71366.1 50S ribosomal protein L9 [Mycoplasma sp. 1654_15]
MKVILIKDSKDGKANTVIEVSPGYASNYLFKNKIAVPYVEEHIKALDQRQNEIAKKKEEKHQQDLLLKEQIQALILEFKLKFTNDQPHGSISTKQVFKALEEKGLHLEKHTVEKVHITSLGLTILKVKLSHEVSANLRIKVLKDE